MLVIGAPAPSLVGPTQEGSFDLSAAAGRPVVVYFYLAPQFEAAGALIIGVSRDTVKSHQRFASKECLPFPLVSDEDGAITERWGVWREKKLYGKVSMGIVRSTFLVGADGRILRVWDPAKVNGHATAVLEAVTAA